MKCKWRQTDFVLQGHLFWLRYCQPPQHHNTTYWLAIPHFLTFLLRCHTLWQHAFYILQTEAICSDETSPINCRPACTNRNINLEILSHISHTIRYPCVCELRRIKKSHPCATYTVKLRLAKFSFRFLHYSSLLLEVQCHKSLYYIVTCTLKKARTSQLILF